jgi:hypothetical protein
MTTSLRALLLVSAALAFAPSALFAQTAPPGESADQLAKTLKPILIDAMPAKLYEKSENWGHQAEIPVGVKWRGIKPQVIKSPRNHGEWKKVNITGQELQRTLDLRIDDIKTIDAEKQTFRVMLAFQMGVEYEQQNWANGARIWSGSVRARAQVKADLLCENTLRVELDKNFLPDFILRIRVTEAKLSYDKLVVEHINGIGGTGAKVIGDAIVDTMRVWRPSIERDLLTKASAAIVKTADTRDVRFGFGQFIKTK